MLKNEIELYLKWKKSNYPRAAISYAIHLRRFNDFCKKDIKNIKIIDIVDFNNDLGKKYSKAHVSYAMIVIKDFISFYFRQIGEDGKRKCNLDPSLVKIKVPETNPYYAIPEDEYYRLIDSMRDDEFWHAQRKIVVRLLYETGIRVSELCALDVEDINNKEHSALIRTKKGIEKGWICWSDDLHETMINFLGVRLCLDENSNLFVTERRRTRPTTRTIERWVKQAVEESGIDKPIVAHSFRHGKAHYMYDHGADLIAVSKALRHSRNNINGAQAYLRFNKKECEKVLRPYLPPARVSVDK